MISDENDASLTQKHLRGKETTRIIIIVWEEDSSPSPEQIDMIHKLL